MSESGVSFDEQSLIEHSVAAPPVSAKELSEVLHEQGTQFFYEARVALSEGRLLEATSGAMRYLMQVQEEALGGVSETSLEGNGPEKWAMDYDKAGDAMVQLGMAKSGYGQKENMLIEIGLHAPESGDHDKPFSANDNSLQEAARFLTELADAWAKLAQDEPFLRSNTRGVERAFQKHISVGDNLVEDVLHVLQLNHGKVDFRTVPERGTRVALEGDELKLALTALRAVPWLVREASTYEVNSTAMQEMVTPEQLDERLIGILDQPLESAEAMAYGSALTEVLAVVRFGKSGEAGLMRKLANMEPGKERDAVQAELDWVQAHSINEGVDKMRRVVRATTRAALRSLRGKYESSQVFSDTQAVLLDADRFYKEMVSFVRSSMEQAGHRTFAARVWQSATAELGNRLHESMYSQGTLDLGAYRQAWQIIGESRGGRGKLGSETRDWLAQRLSSEESIAAVKVSLANELSDGLQGAMHQKIARLQERVYDQTRIFEGMGMPPELASEVLLGEDGVVVQGLGEVMGGFLGDKERFAKMPAGEFMSMMSILENGFFEVVDMSLIGKGGLARIGARMYEEAFGQMEEALRQYVGLETGGGERGEGVELHRLTVADRVRRIRIVEAVKQRMLPPKYLQMGSDNHGLGKAIEQLNGIEEAQMSLAIRQEMIYVLEDFKNGSKNYNLVGGLKDSLFRLMQAPGQGEQKPLMTEATLRGLLLKNADMLFHNVSLVGMYEIKREAEAASGGPRGPGQAVLMLESQLGLLRFVDPEVMEKNPGNEIVRLNGVADRLRSSAKMIGAGYKQRLSGSGQLVGQFDVETYMQEKRVYVERHINDAQLVELIVAPIGEVDADKLAGSRMQSKSDADTQV